MKINERILKVVNEEYDNPNEMIGYLTVLYFSGRAKGDFVQERAIELGIIKKVGGQIKFTIPFIIVEEENKSVWNWVENEYVKLFTDIGKDPYTKEVIKRMKKFFSENPDIRKDEVIGASVMYIKNTETRYVRQPHYFICKGVGIEKVSDLLLWIDKYRIANAPETEKRHISRNAQ